MAQTRAEKKLFEEAVLKTARGESGTLSGTLTVVNYDCQTLTEGVRIRADIAVRFSAPATVVAPTFTIEQEEIEDE
jgi:hypothetical protein